MIGYRINQSIGSHSFLDATNFNDIIKRNLISVDFFFSSDIFFPVECLKTYIAKFL